MDEIATTRPSTLESFDEFTKLHEEVVEAERKLREIDGEEFALSIKDFNTWWDGRTQKVLVFSDCSVRERTVIAFMHAREPAGPEDCVSVIAFDNVLGTKTRSIDFSESLDYPAGIVGINKLGAFQINNSKWLRDVAPEQHETVFHYCVVFDTWLFECLSTNYTVTSCNNKADGAALFLQELSLPW